MKKGLWWDLSPLWVNRLMRRLTEYKSLFTLCALVLLLTIVVYIISLFWPKIEEPFFEFALLGRNKVAEEYFPNSSSSLDISSNVLWYIQVHNHMGSNQSVLIRVKILNSTMQAPDDRKHECSPYPHIIEFPLSLSNAETILTPFDWSILEAEFRNNVTAIKGLEINNQMIEVEFPIISENRFRMVFELWIYNGTSNQYEFRWYSGKETYSVSLYMWFEVISSESMKTETVCYLIDSII